MIDEGNSYGKLCRFGITWQYSIGEEQLQMFPGTEEKMNPSGVIKQLFSVWWFLEDGCRCWWCCKWCPWVQLFLNASVGKECLFGDSREVIEEEQEVVSPLPTTSIGATKEVLLSLLLQIKRLFWWLTCCLEFSWIARIYSISFGHLLFFSETLMSFGVKDGEVWVDEIVDEVWEVMKSVVTSFDNVAPLIEVVSLDVNFFDDWTRDDDLL